MIETYRGVVHQWELDHMGHLNVRSYQAMFEAASWHVYGAVGITPTWMRDHARGMAVVEQRIRYRSELGAGALVVITSEVTEIKDKSLHFVHHLHEVDSGTEAATSEFVSVHIDTEARTACSFPPFVRTRAEEAGLFNPG